MLAARAAVDGLAIGRSQRFPRANAIASAPVREGAPALREVIAHVRRDLQRLLTVLPPDEAQLFEPEAYILDEIEPRLLARSAVGQSWLDAVIAETSCGCSDLVIDVRSRLLSVLEGTAGELAILASHDDDDVVVVTDFVTPSMVASLPRHVRGLIATLDGPTEPRRDVGRTSHAAILARGRGLPIAYVSRDESAFIAEGAWLVIDAKDETARVFVDPEEELLAEARRRHHEEARARLAIDELRPPLGHLGVDVRVNVTSPQDEIPATAGGVGLVRTEMMFTGRLTAPSESEQLAALLLVSANARGRPLVVRLFDAGGDKPLAWLGGAASSQGVGRLLAHPRVLATQLRALARAREHADVRALLPFVRSAAEVNAVRALTATGLELGAMVESPDAVEAISSIAAAADFVSIGTNDLTATTLGLSRTDAAPTADPRVLELVRRAIVGSHAAGRKVTICGELAADERGAMIAVGLGADAISVAPRRLSIILRALGGATREGCRAAAEAAIDPGRPSTP